jgi:uncharacterized paraquat-inducible protein A
MAKRLKLEKGKKFCPRCGAVNNVEDAYCIRCRYDFRQGAKKRKGKNSFGKIILVLIIIAAAWAALRIFLKKPIIPTELIDIVKNITLPKLG